MKQERTTQAEMWGGIFRCLNERPMTMSEMSEKILDDKSAGGVGRVAVRIEEMIKGGLVTPMLTKGLLMFRLEISRKE